MAEAVRVGYGEVAYLVLGGTAWPCGHFSRGQVSRDNYFQPWVVEAVTVVDPGTFITQAHQVRL